MPLDASNLFVSAVHHGVDDEVVVVGLRNPHYSYGYGNAIPSVQHELMLALLAPNDQHVSIERKNTSSVLCECRLAPWPTGTSMSVTAKRCEPSIAGSTPLFSRTPRLMIL
jgi:hypothetical protein